MGKKRLRCKAVTLEGNRCKRLMRSHNYRCLCTQHDKMQAPGKLYKGVR